MNIHIGKLRIELIDESNYSFNSTDNYFQYQNNYINDEDDGSITQIGIKLYEDNILFSNAIVRSSGGASGIHPTSHILTNDSIVMCCAKSVFKLSIPKLTLEWVTKSDDVTCFQIFNFNEDFIVHGELNISKLSSNGEILWQNGGADIFITETGEENFQIKNEMIHIKDWSNHEYIFDLNGKQLN